MRRLRRAQPTGIPDISALANDINEQCAKNAYIIQGIAETCPPGRLACRPVCATVIAFVGATHVLRDRRARR